jgi:hypothetical protein
MANKTYTIDLQDFRTPGAKVFTTRPRGIQVREDSHIDSLEPQFDHIVIRIPDDISSINPSFLEEFLEHVVTKLGENGFRQKFAFDNPGRYKIDLDLTEAIERILRIENALAS